MEKFILHPTYISTKIVDQDRAEFPAFTICPGAPAYNKERLKENGIANIKAYNYHSTKSSSLTLFR
jgi:hypothetical protein